MKHTTTPRIQIDGIEMGNRLIIYSKNKKKLAAIVDEKGEIHLDMCCSDSAWLPKTEKMTCSECGDTVGKDDVQKLYKFLIYHRVKNSAKQEGSI